MLQQIGYLLRQTDREISINATDDQPTIKDNQFVIIGIIYVTTDILSVAL